MSDPEYLKRLSKELTDKGQLIEAGWVGLRLAIFPDGAPKEQLTEMRKAFFAGAQHLFSSIMTILDEDREPTEADMKRMILISDELEKFGEQLKTELWGETELMIPMSEAPRDGRSILLFYVVRPYKDVEWERDGHKWEQFRFIDGHWEAWCGNWRTRSTHTVREEDCEGWAPNPMDDGDYFVTEFYHRNGDKEAILTRVALNSYPEWVMELWTKLQPQGTS